jgi:threonine dehydrogenase-like Zn-dependent dehydrogenase
MTSDTMMRAAVLTAPKRFELQEQPVPRPAPGEVLVRVDACGVCASDFESWLGEGDFPRVLGHEVAATVVELGPSTRAIAAGGEVAVWAPGRGYSDYLTVPAGDCYPAERAASDRALAEPLSCALNAVQLASPDPGDAVVVFGAGFLGNLVQLIVQLRAPRLVIVVEPRPDARARARRLGADAVCDPATDDPAEVVREVTRGGLADVCFEVTGAQPALFQVGGTLRDHGKLALVGFHRWQREVPLGQWNWHAFELLNAHFRDPRIIREGMRGAVGLIERGVLDLAPLVSHRYPLERVGEAFRDGVDKPDGFVKAMIELAP